MRGAAAVLDNLFDPEAKPWAKFRFQRLVVRTAAVMWSEGGIHGNQLAIRFGFVSSSKAYKVVDTLIEEKYLERGGWAFGKKQAPRILENEENKRRLAEQIDPRHLEDFLRVAFDNVLETRGIGQGADSSPANALPSSSEPLTRELGGAPSQTSLAHGSQPVQSETMLDPDSAQDVPAHAFSSNSASRKVV